MTVPPFRPDVEREVDVIEEVARLWGYDRLPTPAATPVPLVPASDTASARLLDRVRHRLAALGFRELYTNSLVPGPTAPDVRGRRLDGPGRGACRDAEPESLRRCRRSVHPS